MLKSALLFLPFNSLRINQVFLVAVFLFDTSLELRINPLTVSSFLFERLFLLTPIVEFFSALLHECLVFLGGGRSFNLFVNTFKVRVLSNGRLRFLSFHSRVNVLVSRVHVSSKLGARLALVEVVRDRLGRLFALLS